MCSWNWRGMESSRRRWKITVQKISAQTMPATTRPAMNIPTQSLNSSLPCVVAPRKAPKVGALQPERSNAPATVTIPAAVRPRRPEGAPACTSSGAEARVSRPSITPETLPTHTRRRTSWHRSRTALGGRRSEHTPGHRRPGRRRPRLVDLGIDLLYGGVVRRRTGGELRQVARELQVVFVAGGDQFGGSFSQSTGAAGEGGDLGRHRAGGSRRERRRVAVPPASVEPPDVPHDELRLVVDRPQVGTLEQVLRGDDGVQHVVEASALVHHPQGLVDERLEQRGG